MLLGRLEWTEVTTSTILRYGADKLEGKGISTASIPSQDEMSIQIS